MPGDANVAAATPTKSVNVEIKPSFNPKIILRIFPSSNMFFLSRTQLASLKNNFAVFILFFLEMIIDF